MHVMLLMLILMMLMLIMLIMIMVLIMVDTYSLSVDGVNCKEKSRNKGKTRWHAQATPVSKIFRIFEMNSKQPK